MPSASARAASAKKASDASAGATKKAAMRFAEMRYVRYVMRQKGRKARGRRSSVSSPRSMAARRGEVYTATARHVDFAWLGAVARGVAEGETVGEAEAQEVEATAQEVTAQAAAGTAKVAGTPKAARPSSRSSPSGLGRDARERAHAAAR